MRIELDSLNRLAYLKLEQRDWKKDDRDIETID